MRLSQTLAISTFCGIKNAAFRCRSPEHLKIVETIKSRSLRGHEIDSWFLAKNRPHDVKPEIVVGLKPDRHSYRCFNSCRARWSRA
jgi:hypothetical protein